MSMTQVQEKLKAPKGQFNKFGNYKYRSCEDIVEAVKPVLREFGYHLNISDDVVMLGDRFYVKATASVINGTEVLASSTAFAREPSEQKGMSESQITGTASSYARKYAMNGLFAIDDTKDVDTEEHKIESEARGLRDKKASLPEPSQELQDMFSAVDSMDDLQALWASLSSEDKKICTGLKNDAKARLS